MSSLTYVDDSLVPLNDVLDLTGYTIKYILEKLYQNNPKFVQKLNGDRVIKITAYDLSEGKGYCSRVFKVTICFEKSDDYAFILKIPTDDRWNEFNADFSEAQIEENKVNICVMHNTECDAYDLVTELKEFPIPEIYYSEFRTTKDPGMIIMQDLSQQGVSFGTFCSVTQEQCFNLAKIVADFQTYVDSLPEKSWKGKFKENVHAKSLVETTWKKMLQPAIDCKYEIELAKKCEFFMKIDGQKLGKYSTEIRAEEIGCTTLMHGDMWTNNMLIKLNDDGSISNQILAIIDWQTFCEGSPLFDITRFVTNCADAEVRRECERKVVDFYFDYLTKKYAEHGKKPNFTREEAHELYDLAFIQETFLALVMYAIMGTPLINSENSADRAKVKKLALRLHLLFDDAIEIMERRGLKDKFKFDKT